MYIRPLSWLAVTHLKQRLRKSSATSLQCSGRGGPCALRFTICSICRHTRWVGGGGEGLQEWAVVRSRPCALRFSICSICRHMRREVGGAKEGSVGTGCLYAMPVCAACHV